ncbi:hypothetical protein K437DRAFT_257600 [Tilletiaria anomala UBC 951]|uniref:Spindle assembly checkpoint component MAD1 n=1 Tax=Tilletiaria anomala (strain ATCC 24038 / CBS 436.72 / UBC 951) TaxID=1037660 RepID=A0A066VWM7_TILAU|nr:uncharacterized protein K437DRAFT_257600 [Tilletiaria anomala UBC 951]KDN43219.1 hypothetical protein K437DRAFT_257600 [Tilletiaria anomala UBC 951]
MEQRRKSQNPGHSGGAGGSSGIPRATSALPRLSASTALRIPSGGIAGADHLRNGTRSAMPERRTYASGLPAPGAAPRSFVSGTAGNSNCTTAGGVDMIGSQAGQKRRASQSYIAPPSSRRPASAQGVRADEADAQSDVFEQPLHDDGAPPSAKRLFRPSSRLSNASSIGDAAAIPSLAAKAQQASTAARESLTSIADISAVRHDYQVRLVHVESRNGELEREIIEKTRQIERFQRERLEMLQEWESLQMQKRTREEEHMTEIEGLRKELKEYREMLGVSEADLEQKTTELDQYKQSTRQEITRLEMELIAARTARDASDAERQRFQKQLEDVTSEVKELRDIAGKRDPTMTMGRRADQDGGQEALRQELHRQVTHLKKLEASQVSLTSENMRLKSQLESIELVREEKRGLESKIRQLEMRNMELLGLEEDARKAKEEVEKWEACLHGLNNPAVGARQGADADGDIRAALRIAEATSDAAANAFVAPARPTPFNRYTLPSYLTTLESSLFASLSKLRGLLELLQRASADKKRLEEEVEAGEKRNLETEMKWSKSRVAAERAELAEQRAKDETDRYKALLDSFQMEQKIKKSSFDEANLQRIDVLEAQLGEYRVVNARLEEEIKQAQQQASAFEQQLRGAPSQLQAAQAQQTLAEAEAHSAASAEATSTIAALEKELQSLGEENEKLWARIGRGEFDQSKFQVLTLANNPLDQARNLRAQRLNALKEENEALLAKIDELSAALAAAAANGAAQLPSLPVSSSSAATGAGAGAELVPRAVVESLKMELESAQKQFADKDKMFLRLRQVYAFKAAEFRDVVTSLFGWKLKFMESGKVKLTSAFSRSASAASTTTLVFQSGEGDAGSMRLMGEATKEGLADVQGLRDKWLGQGATLQSIPCFLAELNQQLFESCTRVARVYGYLDEGQEKHPEN